VVAPPGADVTVGEDGDCSESDEGGTVEVGDIP
jgi:hypothetical protein